MRRHLRTASRPTVRSVSSAALVGVAALALASCGSGALPRAVSEAPDVVDPAPAAEGTTDRSDRSDRTDAASPPADPGAADDGTQQGTAGTDPSDVPEDPVTLDVTWPQAWEEQPAAADSLPSGSLAMATVTQSGTIAAATVVLHEDPAGTTDMAAVLVERGADPASVVEGEARTVAGSSVTRWEARSASGEWDTIAYPVPGPDGLVALFSFVVTADRADEVEEDIASVLDSVELD